MKKLIAALVIVGIVAVHSDLKVHSLEKEHIELKKLVGKLVHILHKVKI